MNGNSCQSLCLHAFGLVTSFPIFVNIPFVLNCVVVFCGFCQSHPLLTALSTVHLGAVCAV